MSHSASRISIFGLGYVGCVSAACLARDGHDVTGVDVSAEKVASVNAGKSPVVEPGLPQLIADAVQAGRLRATLDAALAVRESEVIFICVGTPAAAHAALEIEAVQRVCEQIGNALRAGDCRRTVVVRSTLQPGDTEAVVIPALEAASGGHAGRDFGVCYIPEFLREGTAVSDFTDAPRAVIGELDAPSGAAVAGLFGAASGGVRTNLRAAEMLKLVDNAFHALKVAFSNEVGRLCKAAGIDGSHIMDMVAQDTRLNVSPAYMRAGFAFGGSCLPKDLRALLGYAGEKQVESPLLQAVLTSNERHKDLAFELIRRSRRKRVAVLGLSFKPDIDDVRDSPAVELAARLVREGYQVRVYDRHMWAPKLFGANRQYVERVLPQLATLQHESLAAALEDAEVVVIAQRDPHFAMVLDNLRPEQLVIDLVRIRDDATALGGRYEGICW